MLSSISFKFLFFLNELNTHRLCLNRISEIANTVFLQRQITTRQQKQEKKNYNKLKLTNSDANILGSC